MSIERSNVKKVIFWYRYMYVVLIIMAVIITAIKPILGIPALIMIGTVAAAHILSLKGQTNLMMYQYIRDLEVQMDDSVISAIQYNPLPLCMIGSDGVIVWANKKFRQMFPAEEDPEGQEIYDLTGLRLFSMSNEELAGTVVNVSAINRFFRVQSSESAEQEEARRLRAQEDPLEEDYTIRMFHWQDITDIHQLRKTYQEEKPCVVHIKVDNLDDILDQAPDDVKASLAGEIEKIIRTWAVKNRAAVVRISKSKYTIVCNQRVLDNTEVKKFSILDEVRKLKTGGDIPASLSIGAGAQGKSLAQTDEFAQAAMDLALGRGGDQAVVRKDTVLDYYGGQTQTAGNRNKGKSRIVAMAMLDCIDQSERVFIMGHKIPDMDSFGAVIGVEHIARLRNKEKEVYIVIENVDSISIPYQHAVETGLYQFIDNEQALHMATPDDLMIVVDTHRPVLAQCSELADIVSRKIIIDHHRRTPDIFKNATLMQVEPYASSASELVTEMLQYTTAEKKNISDFQANVLLSGIVLDTKQFSIKTGVRTFEAASWLRRQGANPVTVRQYFQNYMDIYQRKAEIIARAEQLPYAVAVSYIAEPRRNISALIAQAADDLMDIRNMKASFVLGVDETGTVRVSARSLGEINVQLVMEKIGGGGTPTMAGAQLNTSLREAKIKLIKAIDEYIAADEEKKKAPKSVQKQLRDTIRLPSLTEARIAEWKAAEDAAEGKGAAKAGSDAGSKVRRKDKKDKLSEIGKPEKEPIRGIPNIE